MTVIEKLKDVESTKGTNNKFNKVISYLDDQDFVCVLKFLLDKGKTSGIKAAKLSRTVNPVIYPCNILDSFKSYLDYITVNNNGSDTNVYITQAFCNSTSDRVYAGKIVTKTLKLGIGLKKLKTLQEFSDILTCQAQLAELFYDYPSHPVGKDIILTEKLDGNRCMSIVDDSCVMLSRENKVISGFDSIESELLANFKGYALVS